MTSTARCCGTPFQAISVTAGAGQLALLRCAHCDNQVWSRDGVVLDRQAAFAQLATAYREVPLRARAARDRAASVSAARRAARMASRQTVDLTAAEPSPARDLREMLAGWTVLGAAS